MILASSKKRRPKRPSEQDGHIKGKRPPQKKTTPKIQEGKKTKKT
jgi:hypothetical protein